MDKDTLKALRGSIEKWTTIVEWRGVDMGNENCPLCAKFVNRTDSCVGCPVRANTGKSYCVGSPYRAWNDAFGDEFRQITGLDSYYIDDDPRVIGPKTQCAAEKELAFLISLLPKEA